MAVRPKKHRDMGCEYHYSDNFANLYSSVNLTLIDSVCNNTNIQFQNIKIRFRCLLFHLLKDGT